MTVTRRTVILVNAAVDVPILSHQIGMGGILHGGVGRKKKPDLLPLVKGLTVAFKATSNQTDHIEAN